MKRETRAILAISVLAGILGGGSLLAGIFLALNHSYIAPPKVAIQTVNPADEVYAKGHLDGFMDGFRTGRDSQAFIDKVNELQKAASQPKQPSLVLKNSYGQGRIMRWGPIDITDAASWQNDTLGVYAEPEPGTQFRVYQEERDGKLWIDIYAMPNPIPVMDYRSGAK